MKRISVLLFAMMCLLPVYAMGAVPLKINHQGQVVDLNDNPINKNNCPITIRLYDAAGKLYWSDTFYPNVKDGYFDVVLGNGRNLNSDDYGNPLDFNRQYYVELWVDGEKMEPRQPLNSVPYALQAENANKLGGQPASNYLTNASQTVSTNNLKDKAVTVEKIGDNAVIASKIGIDSITTDKILNGAVTQAKAPFAPAVYYNNSSTPSSNIKILCGEVTSGSDGRVRVTFASPFSGPPRIVLTAREAAGTVGVTGGGLTTYAAVTGFDVNGFNALTFHINQYGSTVVRDLTFTWIAIGPQ